MAVHDISAKENKARRAKLKKLGPIRKKTSTVGGLACESKDHRGFLAKLPELGWFDHY
jgi:hypothetical protein